MTTLFEREGTGGLPFPVDSLRPPGEVPPGKHDEYTRIARKILRASPPSPAEEVRAEACRELARLDAEKMSEGKSI